jgi:hypothetical protein
MSQRSEPEQVQNLGSFDLWTLLHYTFNLKGLNKASGIKFESK